MKMIRQYFQPTGLLKALLECLFLGLILMGIIHRVSGGIEQLLVSNTLFFLSISLAFWLMLRFHIPQGGWVYRIGIEVVAAALLSLLTALVIPVLLNLVGFALPQELNSSLSSLFRLLAGPLYFPLRAGKYIWSWWQTKRRQHLIWDLMHIQLSMAALVAFILILIGGVYIVVNAEELNSHPDMSPFVSFFLRINQTVIPYLGLTIIATFVALFFLFPPAALVSYGSVKRFTRRFNHLAEVTQRFRSGDYAARIEVEGEDEIAQLQKDFNAMAEDLQKALEKLSAERDKVSELLNERRQLIASVSHELRTPIATIQSYIESLNDEKWDEDGSSIFTKEADFEIIQEEIHHLSRLIEDLFTLSRLEVGALGLKMEDVDVRPLLSRMVETFKPSAWQSGKILLVAALSEKPLITQIDLDRLEQILANLIRNAIHHTPPGGIVALSGEQEGDEVIIKVRDTGEGISPDNLPRIWERFYQGTNDKNRGTKGMGLGLALVKELVESMEGEVSVTSQPGEGSEFIIRFKIHQGEYRETTPQ